MAVLLYQVGIFLAIQIAALFGKSARNTAVILITIFSLLQVFISWLLLLQLITILISYSFSKLLLKSKKDYKTDSQETDIYYNYKANNKNENENNPRGIVKGGIVDRYEKRRVENIKREWKEKNHNSRNNPS